MTALWSVSIPRWASLRSKVEDDKPILSIENLEQLELEIKVSEFSIGKVKVGTDGDHHSGYPGR